MDKGFFCEKQCVVLGYMLEHMLSFFVSGRVALGLGRHRVFVTCSIQAMGAFVGGLRGEGAREPTVPRVGPHLPRAHGGKVGSIPHKEKVKESVRAHNTFSAPPLSPGTAPPCVFTPLKVARDRAGRYVILSEVFDRIHSPLRQHITCHQLV